MNLKQKVYDHFQQVIRDKVAMLLQIMADLKESGSNETKSTAGDKHETALAMLQIEQSNARGQLQEALIQKAALDKINPALPATRIVNGSLVKTGRGYFFISTALGKAVIENKTVIALSPQSPLGLQLMGSLVSDVVVIQDTAYVIESIA